LLDDPTVTGPSFGRAYADLVDGWLTSLVGDAADVALVAVGGYGRRELAPASDLDIMLLHDRGVDVSKVADGVWYPIWDQSLQLDHSVRTEREALRVADDDLKAALGLLDARFVAGDGVLEARLATRGLERWRARWPRWLDQLEADARSRHERFGSVAFVLEPDLKDGRGGLRDVTVLRALGLALEGVELDVDVDQAFIALFDARVELQRITGSGDDRLLLDHQDAVADRLDIDDADVLMQQIATAARTITWHLDDAWRMARSTVKGPRRRSASGRDRALPGGLVVRDGEITLASIETPASDVALLLVAATAAARELLPIARSTMRRFDAEIEPLDHRWSDETRRSLVDLLAVGPPMVRVFETLDRYDLVSRILPEWSTVRSRPQRNAFHRFTVDRHLLEATAHGAELADRVQRTDLLLVGLLLHDLGKGSPGDHTEAGIGLARTVATRMGYGPEDVETLVDLVRYHLLLPSVATSRDLDDPEIITSVGTTVRDPAFLDLLAALTEADSLATGPRAWTRWKAGLVDTLVRRVHGVLDGSPHVPASATDAVDAELVARAGGAVHVEGSHRHVVVVAPDQPRLFSRVVGVLALHGHDVRAARARSSDGMAISEYDIEPFNDAEPDWKRFAADLLEELDGTGRDLEAALSERADRYGHLQRPTAARLADPHVVVDNEASSTATILEVHAVDAVGVLFRIADVLADAGLDIRHAKISTLGAEVIDTFYVVTGAGDRITDATAIEHVTAALMGAITDRAT
jgi:[protein-PII] uridylyltransferase